jgi:hypothetical protein
MPSTANIVELRRLLTERHPEAHGIRHAWTERPVLATGLPPLDALLHGGWPKGQLSELVGTGDGSGSAQVLHALLQQRAAEGQFLALVDGQDSFDVDAVESEVLARLLWVRCERAEQALTATDILLRDRNIPFVVLDLKLNPAAQLRRIASSVWHRFRRLQEQHGTSLLVITPTQLVGGAHCRVRVESHLGMKAWIESPSTLASDLRFELLRSGHEEESGARTQTA